MNDMKATGALELSSAIDIGYLDVNKVEFFKTGGGFTGLKYDGKEYKRISLRRALPIGMPSSYISVADSENKEIGMIKDVNELPDGQMGLVVDELDKRYYCPTVKEVKSVKDKLGYVYIEMTVSASDGSHEKSCAIKDVNKNIRMLDDDRLLMFDVDGNRYIVPSLAALDAKSLRRLEPYLF